MEAYAVGDAYGKATEYCTRQQVEEAYPSVCELLPPEKSLTHEDLRHGQVTDDTEQNVYLIREYGRKKTVSSYDTAMCLLRWVEETDAATKYIGPNSLRALNAIREGAEIATAGTGGITCGGMMRSPAAFLFSTAENLEENVVSCLMPTHYTSIAIEAALCYARALEAAANGKTIPEMLEAACLGARQGKKHGSTFRTAGVGPSCEARIRFLAGWISPKRSETEVKEFLYDVMGATMSSCDVCSCAFGLFLYAERDVEKAIRMATEMGGDSDTIGCLAAGLCAMYAGEHHLPREMVELVEKANQISFEQLAETVVQARKIMYGEELE